MAPGGAGRRPPQPPAVTGPVASKGLRAAARAIDSIAGVVLGAAVLVAFGDAYRLWTDAFLVWLALALYEALTTGWLGATPGKRLCGLRVAELDRLGAPSAAAAWRRAATSSLLLLLTPLLALAGTLAIAASSADPDRRELAVVGGLVLASSFVPWAIWLASILGDPLGRGVGDRTGTTIVTADRYRGVVAIRDLPGFADAVRPPRLLRLGRVADADVRFRARLRRLDDAPVLGAAIGLLALAASVPLAGDDPRSVRLVVLASSVAWIVLFVVVETRQVAATGRTRGHELAGLVISRRDRLAPPSTGRSFARALVLALMAYVPLLWPLLGASLLMMRLGAAGRGLHDLAGGTVVLADPALSPEAQRQRSMRMRLGRVG